MTTIEEIIEYGNDRKRNWAGRSVAFFGFAFRT